MWVERCIGFWLWLRSLIMHRVSSLSFVWHRHGMGVHMHLSNHSKIVGLGGLLSKFLALICVKKWVDLLAYNVWAIRGTALLWHDIS